MLGNLIEFIGRTHLVVLHFPIALIITLALIELWALAKPRIQRTAERGALRPSVIAMPIFLLAFLATAVTLITGLIFGFDDGERVDLHRIVGIVSAALVLLTGAAMLFARRPGADGAAKLYLALLTISAIAVGFAGHLGGELTHGKGFITRPLTQGSAATTTPIAQLDPAAFGISAESLATYTSTIQPIFDAHCIDCHAQEDPEDDVRLDALEFVLDPELDIVRRGDPDSSELVYLIDLPAGDPDIMPPSDHSEPLSREQIESITSWIELLQ
jgi:uncharacterized membrane protein